VALQVSGKTNYLFFVALQVSGKNKLFIFCGLTGIRKNRIRRGAVFMLSRTITGKYTNVVYDYNTTASTCISVLFYFSLKLHQWYNGYGACLELGRLWVQALIMVR
jgi:hypothetical protein